MFVAIWTFVKDPANREAVGWLGGGIVLAAGGVWAVVKFYTKREKPSVRADRGSVAFGGSNSGTINVGARGKDKH